MSKKVKLYEEFIDYKIKKDLKIKFFELKKNWYNETGIFSDPNDIFDNKNYLEMIKLGKGIIPFLIESLDENSILSKTLRDITGENPIPEKDRLNSDSYKKYWQNWYNKNIK